MSQPDSAGQPAERDDSTQAPPAPQARPALQAVQAALDRRDNGGDGAAMLDR
jgi:hypothetical protein